MPKIAFVGAGSTVFTRNLVGDVLSLPELAGSTTFVFNGDVPNTRAGRRLIDNLPADCCVEVPCTASQDGIEPHPVGALPRHLAALMQTNVNVQGLTVEAALTGRREPVHHAAMLDPHTAAELPLDEIAALVDALLDAHGEWIPPPAPSAPSRVP